MPVWFSFKYTGKIESTTEADTISLEFRYNVTVGIYSFIPSSVRRKRIYNRVQPCSGIKYLIPSPVRGEIQNLRQSAYEINPILARSRKR
jgi:hypothetical protein